MKNRLSIALISVALAGVSAWDLYAVVGESKDVWRFPEELSSELLTRDQVCERSRDLFPQYEWIIVAIKSHACDHSPTQECLKETYFLSDPCNRAVHDRFGVFHLRAIFNSRDAQVSKSKWSDNDREKLLTEWEVDPESGPSWVILKRSDCRVVGKIPRSQIFLPETKTWIGGHSPDETILAAEYMHLSKVISEHQGQQWSKKLFSVQAHNIRTCLKNRESPSLTEFWDALDRCDVQ